MFKIFFVFSKLLTPLATLPPSLNPSTHSFRYELLLVDVVTHYTWLYGLTTLTSSDIISAFEAFVTVTGAYPMKFHGDFDQKLIDGASLSFINKQRRIIAAPAHRQSSNGLVESSWQTIILMTRAYITEKHVSWEFWYFTIKHSVLMLNQIHGCLGCKLTTPFELVHGVKPDAATWFELFSGGYFDHTTKNSSKKSKSEVQNATVLPLAGVINPTQSSFTILSPSPMLTIAHPSSNSSNSMRVNFPFLSLPPKSLLMAVLYEVFFNTIPTRPRNHFLLAHMLASRFRVPQCMVLEAKADVTPDGTVKECNITPKYTILLDDNTTQELNYHDLVSPSTNTPVDPSTPDMVWAIIPSQYLHPDATITLENDGVYHKGYLNYFLSSGFEFVVDFTIPLPNFARNWTLLLANETLLLGHTLVSSFLWLNTYHNAPSARYVSAKHLLKSMPVFSP
eukprot:CCRYP_011184-RA/>CCRYP_011184-RA protein AED:0.41 eAED:0.38 QI:0/0/0/1/0/0/4/0/449